MQTGIQNHGGLFKQKNTLGTEQPGFIESIGSQGTIYSFYQSSILRFVYKHRESIESGDMRPNAVLHPTKYSARIDGDTRATLQNHHISLQDTIEVNNVSAYWQRDGYTWRPTRQ